MSGSQIFKGCTIAIAVTVLFGLVAIALHFPTKQIIHACVTCLPINMWIWCREFSRK